MARTYNQREAQKKLLKTPDVNPVEPKIIEKNQTSVRIERSRVADPREGGSRSHRNIR